MNCADRVDVAGHPGDQGAPLLGGLGEQRQVVDVPERTGPQHPQRGLRRPEQAAVHEHVRRHRHREDQGREPQAAGDEPQVDRAGADDPAVDDPLDRHRDDDLARRRDHCQHERQPQAAGDLGSQATDPAGRWRTYPLPRAARWSDCCCQRSSFLHQAVLVVAVGTVPLLGPFDPHLRVVRRRLPLPALSFLALPLLTLLLHPGLLAVLLGGAGGELGILIGPVPLEQFVGDGRLVVGVDQGSIRTGPRPGVRRGCRSR